MDPFEEFEFKPLTDGLGFHKRNKASEGKLPDFNTLEKRASLELMEPSFTNPAATTIATPLPRKSQKESSIRENAFRDLTPPETNQISNTQVPNTQNPKNNAVDEILKNLNHQKNLEIIEPSTFLNSEEKVTFKKSSLELSAAILDSMLIVATFLASMISLLIITKADLMNNLSNPDEQGIVYIGLIALFGSITWIYLTTCRVFLGQTPGEWVFDQRLGTPEMLGSAEYSLKVAIRSLIVLLTGFIVFPILSLIMGKDLLGQLLGLELTKKATA